MWCLCLHLICSCPVHLKNWRSTSVFRSCSCTCLSAEKLCSVCVFTLSAAVLSIRKTDVERQFSRVADDLHKCWETMRCLCFHLICSCPVHSKNWRCLTTSVIKILIYLFVRVRLCVSCMIKILLSISSHKLPISIVIFHETMINRCPLFSMAPDTECLQMLRTVISSA